MTYREILTSINKGDYSPVYILMGEEDYYINLIMDALERKVVDEEDKDFNLNTYFGVDADMDVVVSAAQQMPVMAPRRLVLLKEAQSKMQAKQQLDKLAPYVSHPNPGCVLAIAFKGDVLNATSALLKAAKKSGVVVFNSEKVKDYNLPTHVKDYCVANKCGIDDNAVRMLCEYIGRPLTKLFGELNKLISIKGKDNGKITAEDVERNIGISKDFNNFELVSAIAKRNYPKAVQIVKYFEANPKTNPTIMTTGQLFTFFTRLVSAHYLPSKSDADIKSALGIRFAPQLNELKDAMRNYNPYQSVYALHALRDFDVKSKGVESFQNEYDLLLELIFKIFTL